MPAAIAIKEVEGKPGKVYCPLQKVDLPNKTPQGKECLITISAAALNHRDLFIRQKLYPGVAYGVPLLADGVGIVTATGDHPEAQKWLKKRVVINPGTGWDSDPDGPENGVYAIVGGTSFYDVGTLAEEMIFNAGELEEAPVHLSDAEAAAIPLAGLTAWRAFNTKSGNAKAGRNVLVTGIGGGVAIMVLLFAVNAGCNVWVTSGSEDKIKKAQELGAKGGVSYKDQNWEQSLLEQLPKERPYLDAIIDGAGGDIVPKGSKILKHGGVIVSYGMTLGPRISFAMPAVLKNIELRGSTMGSRKDFAEMIQFVRGTKLKPVVSRVAHGLDIAAIDSLYDDMNKASQFGKLVVQIQKDPKSKF